MSRCPRCGAGLDIEYDKEGSACGVDCSVCDWPQELVECECCEELLPENKVEHIIMLNQVESYVCEGCLEMLQEEE